MKVELIVPVLYSADVERSIKYYREVLGFESDWTWDDKPTFGGVNWGEVAIYFCKDGQGHPGTWICINIDNVDEYYESIKGRGAKILSLPESMPWFMREMLVEDPDGHILRFGHGIDCD